MQREQEHSPSWYRPIVAAGPISGILAGAASGGIAGGLLDWGIPEEESRQIESEVKQGKH